MTTIQNQKTDYIIGVDIGTSSSKALAFSTSGKLLTQFQNDYDTAHPRPGYSEQNADEILKAIIGVIHSVVKQMNNQQPVCVCFSSAMHSLMAVDEKGKPLSSLIIWSDGRSQKQAENLKEQKIATDIYEHTGTPIHAMSPLCKLLWWKKEKGDSFKKTARFISIKEYVFSHFFGEYLADYSLASATGLFDHSTLEWYAPSLDLIGIKKEHLSTPVSPLHICKGLKENYDRHTGLEKNIPFVVGAGDGCLANLGTGVTQKGELAVTIGTSGAVRLYTDKPLTDEKQRLFNYLLIEKEFISGGAINNGGVLLDWFRSQLMVKSKKEVSYEDLLKEAFQAETGSNGLIFLPYLLGERSPMWDTRARGAFIGLQVQHERKHFMRAVIEGICFSLYDSANILEHSPASIDAVYVSGGFTRSAEWVQMLADLFGKEVKVSGYGDASSVGAAFMGMRAMGMIHSWEEAEKFIPMDKTLSPQKDQMKIYRRNFEVFSKMYALLKPTMHEIAGWQQEE